MNSQEIHAHYCRLSGRDIPYHLNMDYAWSLWLSRYTLTDLELVIRYIERGIAAGTRQPGALKWRNLIWDLDRFADDLGEAKAVARNTRPPMTPKQQVVKEFTRTSPETNDAPAKSVSQIMPDMKKLFESMRKAAG